MKGEKVVELRGELREELRRRRGRRRGQEQGPEERRMKERDVGEFGSRMEARTFGDAEVGRRGRSEAGTFGGGTWGFRRGEA
jgi:hypothetical protein